jgi:hypothetical protein
MTRRREVQPDFEDLCACLNSRSVDYVIVGSEAVAVHGWPRYSLDFDIAVRPTVDNARRVFEALGDFGFGTALERQSPEDWIRGGQILQLGVKPNQVHILLELTGISYEDATSDAVAAQYGATFVRYIGYEALLKNKRATGRAKDLADVEALERARRSDRPD